MSCEPWQVKLEQYADSELHGDEAVALEAHLRQCQSCAADALGRLRMKGMIHTAGKRYTPSTEFRLKIAQQVARQSKPRLWNFRLGSRPGAVAAGLIAAIRLAAVWVNHAQRERQLGEACRSACGDAGQRESHRRGFNGSAHGKAVVRGQAAFYVQSA